MKKIMLEMMKEQGSDLNEILDMPFSFFMELVDEDNQKNVKQDRKSTRLNSSHTAESRMPSSA